MSQDLSKWLMGSIHWRRFPRKTGKSIGGELRNRDVKGCYHSKDELQDAFISATSAGGKFFGMSSEGAKTLNGQISMLEGSAICSMR